MNNLIESGRGDIPPEKKVLPKEELNQSVDELITAYMDNLNMLEEFNAAKKPGYPGDIFIRTFFNKGGSEYRVDYGESSSWVALAMKRWLDVDERIQDANGDVRIYSIKLVSRTPFRKFVPGGAEAKYSSMRFPKMERGLWKPPFITEEKERNTPLALQRAREMLAGLSPQK